MSAMPEIRRDPGLFQELAHWWNSCPGPLSTPFLRSEWFGTWVDAFMPDRSKLEVVVWSDRGVPVAALPLSRSGMRRSALANSHTEVFDVVANPDEDTAEAVRRWLAGRPVTRLFRLDGGSRLVPVGQDPNWHVDRRDGAPFTDLEGGPEAALSVVGRGVLKNLRRLGRRLEELGEVVYLDNADGLVPDVVEKCMRLEASGWKGRERTAMSSRPDSARFYASLIDLARDQGWLRICALLVAERLAAFEFDLDYSGRRFSLKAGYDEDLSRLSPGKVLQLRVIEAAASQGLSSYEFGGVAEPWKMDWAHGVRPRLNVLRFGASGPSRLLGMAMRKVLERRSSPAHDSTEGG
jgi:CelD/BcsL family acetyltransferase involved in cellulose biosynthesis